MPDTNNMSICACIIPTYRDFIAENVGQQNSANTLFQSMASTVTASQRGTLGSAANGQPLFKSDYARMQYNLGKINQLKCYTAKPAVALGPN
jgi:hypothetical protein